MELEAARVILDNVRHMYGNKVLVKMIMEMDPSILKDAVEQYERLNDNQSQAFEG